MVYKNADRKLICKNVFVAFMRHVLLLPNMKAELKGGLTILLSCVFYSAASTVIKLVSASLSGSFISLVRFVLGIVFVAAALLVTRQSFRIHDIKSWVLRGIFGAVAMTSTYIAIKMTGSGRAILLGDTYPVFVALFGAIFFKEKVRANNMIALLICGAGIALVFYDNSHYSLAGNMVGLLAGICGGFAVHFLKKSREQNNSFVVYLSACIFGAAVCLYSAPQAVQVRPVTFLLLVLLSFLAFAGQICMTFGFKYIAATKGSITGLAEVPLTILLSALFLSEEMNARFVTGTFIILFGLIINFVYSARPKNTVHTKTPHSSEND